MSEKINVAVVGLGFGAEFIPIYQHHPHAELWAICQRSEDHLNEIGDYFGVDRRYTNFQDVLREPALDAVHLNTPIPLHAPMSLAALEAGKHTACTVPMATTTEECLEIVDAQRRSGRIYMMMETAVFTRAFLYVQELVQSDKLGRIQFMRGSHQQNMGRPGWPEYWMGLPPMHYATHAVSPLLKMADDRAESVVCLGSGRIQEQYAEKHGSPFATETALVKLKHSHLACEVTRSLFDTIRQYRESFDVYGSSLSFEWQQTAGDNPVLYSNFEDATRIDVPDYQDRLPDELRVFTHKGAYDQDREQASFFQGGGHGGSHPHLVHEFISSILSGRPPVGNAAEAANWTMTGICAHASAMKGGRRVAIPETL